MDFHSLIQPALLGLIQGLTEFIPISSDGHLVITRQLLGWADQGAMFDAILHVATLLALLVYFRKDIIDIFKSLNPRAAGHTLVQSRRVGWLIVIATVPAVAAGLLFPALFTDTSRTLTATAILMIFMGLMIILAERVARGRKSIAKLTFFDALAIGLAQMAAMLPGVSRSGSTIITGLYLGLKREEAAHFSFLMGTLALALAGGYAFLQIETGHFSTNWFALAVASAIAFGSGLLAIDFMMRFLKRHQLYGFAGYLIVVGAGLVIVKLAGLHLPLF